MKNIHLIKEIEKLYDSKCKLCPVKRGRDGRRTTYKDGTTKRGGIPVRVDADRCNTCPVEKKIKKLRKEMGL